MPTIRSQHRIEQFAQVLQERAHKFPKFKGVRTDDMTIDWYYDERGKPYRVTVKFHKRTGKKTIWGAEEIDYWGFTVEPKNYIDSNHVTKISTANDENKDKIEAYVQELTKEEPIIPRYSLRKAHGAQKRLTQK